MLLGVSLILHVSRKTRIAVEIMHQLRYSPLFQHNYIPPAAEKSVGTTDCVITDSRYTFDFTQFLSNYNTGEMV